MATGEIFLGSSSTLRTTSDDDLVTRIHPQIVTGKCIKFNHSDPFHIGDKYGGIPLNLLTNTIGWTTLMVSSLVTLED